MKVVSGGIANVLQIKPFNCFILILPTGKGNISCLESMVTSMSTNSFVVAIVAKGSKTQPRKISQSDDSIFKAVAVYLYRQYISWKNVCDLLKMNSTFFAV